MCACVRLFRCEKCKSIGWQQNVFTDILASATIYLARWYIHFLNKLKISAPLCLVLSIVYLYLKRKEENKFVPSAFEETIRERLSLAK